MNKPQNRAYRSENLSLLPLSLALTESQKEVPPHNLPKDVNEELAKTLIEKMKEDYQQRGRPVHWVGAHGPTKTVK